MKMKKEVFVLFLVILSCFKEKSANQVSCEKFEGYGWGLGTLKTCYMDKITQIDSADTTITSRDESVQGLWFHKNRKIKFLPMYIGEKFPSLRGLVAADCFLTTISNANFKGLSKLQFLNLENNQIEKIATNVFDDSTVLETLRLSGNKLNFINGKAFARLTKLTNVWLTSNQCIKENFDGASRIAVLQQTVNAKCSHEEELEETPVETSTMTTTTTVSNLVCKKCDENQDLATFTNITLEGIKAETSEVRSEIISNMISKFNELKTQQKEECGNIAKALEAQTKAFKDQQTYFNEALENKTTEIIEAKTQIVLKMSENERQREELQRKNEEIIEKNEKIRKLNEKVETLSRNFK